LIAWPFLIHPLFFLSFPELTPGSAWQLWMVPYNLGAWSSCWSRAGSGSGKRSVWCEDTAGRVGQRTAAARAPASGGPQRSDAAVHLPPVLHWACLQIDFYILFFF